MHNYSVEIKAHEMDKVCSTHRKLINPLIILVRKPKVKDHLVNLDVDGRLL
jgi:hypothetical protein